MKQRNTNQNNMHIDCVSKPAVHGVFYSPWPRCFLFLSHRFHLARVQYGCRSKNKIHNVRNTHRGDRERARSFSTTALCIVVRIGIIFFFIGNRDYFISNAMKYRKPNSHEHTGTVKCAMVKKLTLYLIQNTIHSIHYNSRRTLNNFILTILSNRRRACSFQQR